MSFATELIKFCKLREIKITYMGQTVLFEKDGKHAMSHVFDDLEDIMEILVRTQMIAKEEAAHV